MKLISRGLVAAVMVAIATGAAAQFPPPGQFPSAGASQFPNPPSSGQFTNPNASPFPDPRSPFGQPAPKSGPDPNVECPKFVPIRELAEKRAAAVSAAMERRAPPPEACGLIRAFHDTEGRMLKFLKDNASLCGVPSDVIQQITASHARTTQVRGQICAAAARPAAPPAPTLGEALGTTRIPDASTTRTGRGGAFDTLTGNPIAR